MIDFKRIATAASEGDHTLFAHTYRPRNIEEALVDPFEHEPVPLEVFLYDSHYLNLPPLGERQLRVVKYATDIYPQPLRDLLGLQDPLYDTLTILWGKGSGKDFVSRVSIARAVYLVLCLRDPQGIYGMMQTDSIDLINMSFTAYQAKTIFFKPLSRMLENSPWFRGRFVEHVLQLEFEKKVFAHSGNSSQESFEGFNPLLAVLDEIDAFKTADDLKRYTGSAPEHAAESIYNALRSSVQSRFPGIGKTLLLSFLRRPDGFMMQRYKEAVRDMSQGIEGAFADKAATWEVNPTKTRAMFDREFRRNPEDSAMRYGCVPRPTSANFFRNRGLVYDVFHYDPETDDVIPGSPVNPWQDGDFLPGYALSSKDYFPRYIHIDIGITNDTAAIACVSLVGTLNQGDGLELPLVHVDFLATLDPGDLLSTDPHSLGEIEIDAIRQVIRNFVLKKRGGGRVDIRIISFDSFQSRDSMQILAREGFVTGYRSVDRDDTAYVILKELIYTQRLLAPASRILAKELTALVRVKGNKLDHPTSGSKDLSDALAGAVANLYLEYYGDLDAVVVHDDRVPIGQDYSGNREFGMTIDQYPITPSEFSISDY